VLLLVAALGGCAAVVYRLWQRRGEGRPLLEFEPRALVPWNILPPAVLLFFSFGGLAVAPPEAPTPPPAEETAGVAISAAGSIATGSMGAAAANTAAVAATATGWSPADAGGLTALDMWAQTLAFVTLALAIGAVLVLAYQAGPRDLGLPTDRQQLREDARTGAMALLAVLPPIYVIQTTLTWLLAPSEGHPVIEALRLQYTGGMLVAAAAAAALAAPLFEEVMFRLVFQGWLERTEDRLLRLPVNAPWNAPGVLPGLIRGWGPILISGVVFSAAHWGHGVAPVSLLPLGWTLGYLYQRTHRLAPSIVCHALFNAFNLVMLGLALAAGE
jgi:membrane protease YdiL (CAAX protease family)